MSFKVGIYIFSTKSLDIAHTLKIQGNITLRVHESVNTMKYFITGQNYYSVTKNREAPICGF